MGRPSASRRSSRQLRVDDPLVAHTEHDLGNGQRVACLINHSPERRGVSIEGAVGIALACLRGTLHRGHAGTIVTIEPFDAALLLLGGAGPGD